MVDEATELRLVRDSDFALYFLAGSNGLLGASDDERILCVHNLVLCVWGVSFPLSLVLDDIPPRLWLFFFSSCSVWLGRRWLIPSLLA